MSEQTGILTAINEIMREVGFVKKDGEIKLKNDRGYTVATEAAFIKAVRPLMAEKGIIFYPSDVREVTLEIYETNYGPQNLCTLTIEYTFVCISDGSEVKAVVIGQGSDQGDKAGGGAMTTAAKYAIRQVFYLETGDDPDRVSSEGKQRSRAKSNGHNKEPQPVKILPIDQIQTAQDFFNFAYGEVSKGGQGFKLESRGDLLNILKKCGDNPQQAAEFLAINYPVNESA